MTDKLIKFKQPKIEDKKVGLNKRALAFAIKIFSLVLVLGALVAGVFALDIKYKNKIYPNIKIASLAVGGKTQAEAKKIVDDFTQEVNAEGPELIFENKIYKNRLDEMGVTFDSETQVQAAYNYGRNIRFQNRAKELSYLIIYGKNLEISPYIDEKKLDDYLGKIADVVSVPAINPTLKYENGQIALYSGKNGQGLDKNKLKSDLIGFINKKSENKILLATSEIEPSIKEEGALEAKAMAEKYLLSTPITLNHDQDEFSVSRDKLAAWLEYEELDNKLETRVSDSKLSGFINGIVDLYKIDKVDQEVLDDTGKILKPGKDGVGVNTDAIKKEIKNRIYSGKPGDEIKVTTFVIAFGEVKIYPSAMPGRFPGKYIDVNISEQRLYAFEGDHQVNSFLISSGLWSHPTPLGQFYIYDKSRVTRMRGADYDLPGVEWVSWWSGDYSIHGTYWHNNFGHRMSHGCINASNEDAQWIYNWDDIGTPVYVHN